MVDARRKQPRDIAGAVWRIAWTGATFIVVEGVVCGLAAFPVLLIWWWLAGWDWPNATLRLMTFSLLVVPSYVLFAFGLMIFSSVGTRLVGWRTPPDAALRIADAEWPLLDWARYMASIHVVRVLAGTLFRGSPVWSAYLRLHGARVGRRVYVASLALSDYNLLTLGDDVVIGADVHLSAHTVEAGVVKTASVRIGDGVTIGVGAVIDIGVEAGQGCQVGALSFVPKYSRLEAAGVYVGIPVRPVR